VCNIVPEVEAENRAGCTDNTKSSGGDEHGHTNNVRRIVQVVEEQGHDALPRRTREAVTVVTAAGDALTINIDLDTAVDPTPWPLASTLAQRYQAPTWHLLTQRLALDLSTTALDTLQSRYPRPSVTIISQEKRAISTPPRCRRVIAHYGCARAALMRWRCWPRACRAW